MNALIVDKKEVVSKLVKALKPKYNVDITFKITDISYYDVVFVNLNYLTEKKHIFKSAKHLICLTNINSDILKEQLKEDFEELFYLKYDFTQDELYRTLNKYLILDDATEIVEYLKKDGLKSNVKGFIYLTEMLRLLMHDQTLLKSTMELYEIVAIKYQVSSSQVERNVRYVISKANVEKGTIYNTSEYLLKVINDFLVQGKLK